MIILDQEKAALAAGQQTDDPPQVQRVPVIPLVSSEKSALLGESSRHRRARFLRLSILTSVLLIVLGTSFTPYHVFPSISLHRPPPHRRPRPRPPLSIPHREKIFLSVPNEESALNASRAYATHPHLAGSTEDFEDAKVILGLFQSQLGIRPPKDQPIFSAGTPFSRNATLRLTTPHGPRRPTAWIDVYYPVLNTPNSSALHILGVDGKPAWEADLVEDGDPADEEAHKYRNAVPTWHGFSADGDVSGHLVYANYGRKEDYDELVAQGTNLTDKIVIVRYGAIFRGLKVKGAQELGAAGVLIYSDPRDDGFVTVANGYTPYPHGPARNPTSVQRGSVEYLSTYPGDPTTPGYPAYEDAERKEATNIPTIPSLPISWANAERLLEEIDSAYSETKKLSGNASKAKIRLVNRVNTKVTPIWNTMASIPGHIRDEVVLIGCHRDAWVMGAADPTSGTVSLHEIIRAFGVLLKKGWKPLRTIVIASWDAEEYGLVGSTEWGEDFADWISSHVVSYFNVDVSVYGSQWNTFASPSIAHLMKQAALDIPHPTIKRKTLWDAKGDSGPFKGEQTAHIDSEFAKLYEENQRELRAADTGILPLGSGSDYTVFLQRLGVASSDEGFGFTPTDAVYHYHSIYDSQHWQEIYGDPGFHRHVAVAKHLGLMGLRMTDSIILPLNTTQYALELDDYLDKVESLVPDQNVTPDFTTLRKSIQRLQTASLNLDKEKIEAEEEFKKLLKRFPIPPRGWEFDHGDPLRGVKDVVKRVFGVAPPTRAERRRLAILSGRVRSWEEILEYDLDELERDLLLRGGKDDDDEFEMFERHGDDDDDFEHHPPPPRHPDHPVPPFPIRKFIKAAKRVRQANKKLIAFERGFISEGGIKDREWYKHLGVAPGKWLGYGATTFPALTESLTIEKNVTLAEYEANRLIDLLDKLSDVVEP